MKFTLTDIQERALDLLRRSLITGHRRPMMQGPTGFGKTVVSAKIVEGALRKGNPVLFVVPFLSLVDQTVERFAAQGIHSIGVMQGQHPQTDGDQPVQVASVQTLMRRKLPRASIVLLDEGHRWFGFYGKWMAMPEWEKIPFVGLSATPWTKGLGKHFDDLLIPTTTKELIEKGMLSPFKVFAPSHPDLSKVHTVAGDYHEGELSEAMSEPVLIADAVATWLRLGEDRPTLCFGVDRAHARKLADQFEAAGVPTGYVDMNTPPDERKQIGQRLANGQIKVVCNVFTLTTGIDWDVRCIILARPTKSEILFTQIIGRGLRTAEGKADCLILDHSDTTLRLGFVDDIHHEALDMGKHQQAGGGRREKPNALPKECSSCSLLKPAGVRKCPSCGFEPVRQSPIEERHGELIPLSGRKKGKGQATYEEKQAFYSMLIWQRDNEGRSDKYVLAKYKAKFEAWPRGLVDYAITPNSAFLNWITASNIRWRHGQKKKAQQHAA